MFEVGCWDRSMQPVDLPACDVAPVRKRGVVPGGQTAAMGRHAMLVDEFCILSRKLVRAELPKECCYSK